MPTWESFVAVLQLWSWRLAPFAAGALFLLGSWLMLRKPRRGTTIQQAGTTPVPAPAPIRKEDKFKLESLAPVVMLALILVAIVTLAAAIGTRNPGLWTGFWILAVVTAVVSTAGGKWLGYTIVYVVLLGTTSLFIWLVVAAHTIPFFNKVQLP